MKTNTVLMLLIVIAFVALGLMYAQFMQQEQATGNDIRLLKERVDGFESQVKGSLEAVKNIEARSRANDTEKKDLNSKIETMSKDIQQLQDDVKSALSAKEVKVSVAPVVEPPAPAPVAEQPAVPEPVVEGAVQPAAGQ